MKSIIVGFGFGLFLVGCGPDPKEINARIQKQLDCSTRVQKKFEAEIDECIKRFGTFGSGYKACSDSAGDQFSQESLNCAKLEEH